MARNKFGSPSILKYTQYQNKHKNIRTMTTNPTYTKEQAASKTMCIPAIPTAMATATEVWADSPLLLDYTVQCTFYKLSEQ